jgi:hypothetical protein
MDGAFFYAKPGLYFGSQHNVHDLGFTGKSDKVTRK